MKENSMGLYIEGGYLPCVDSKTVLHIFPDGKVYIEQSGLRDCYERPELQAIEIKTPHGKLIDADELKRHLSTEADEFMMSGNIDWAFAYGSAVSEVSHAPTIIDVED